MLAPSGLPSCAECGASGAGFQKCGQCAVVYYCGVECQKKAWPTHKLECRRIAETAAATESAGSTLERIDAAQDHKEDGTEHYADGDYEAAFRYFRAGANEVAPLGAADVVVGSDVLYDDAHTPALLRSLAALAPRAALFAYELHQAGAVVRFADRAADKVGNVFGGDFLKRRYGTSIIVSRRREA